MDNQVINLLVYTAKIVGLALLICAGVTVIVGLSKALWDLWHDD